MLLHKIRKAGLMNDIAKKENIFNKIRLKLREIWIDPVWSKIISSIIVSISSYFIIQINKFQFLSIGISIAASLIILIAVFFLNFDINKGTQKNRKNFIKRLAEADDVIIVGITNKNLAELLGNALELKRKYKKINVAFWTSIKIIYLSEGLLQYTLDEYTNTAESPETERRKCSGESKRSVYRFLIRETQKQNNTENWDIYEYPYLLPFTGAQFNFANGTQIFQIGLLPADKAIDIQSKNIYYENSNRISKELSNYYNSLFESVIRFSSKQEEMILLCRNNNESHLIFERSRFRRNILGPKGDPNVWIPCVIVLLYSKDLKLPILQIRNEDTATRELATLSNIAGYVNQIDYLKKHEAESESILVPDIYKFAIARELKEEIGLENVNIDDLREVGYQPFYYPNKECLYFGVFSYELDRENTEKVQKNSAFIKTWTINDLITIRKYNILSAVKDFLKFIYFAPKPVMVTGKALINNLLLHDEQTTAELLNTILQTMGKENIQLLEASIENEMKNIIATSQYNYICRDVKKQIIGLAGAQHRYFFDFLLKAYADLQIQEAQEYFKKFSINSEKQSAWQELRAFYNDPKKLRDALVDC
jgi:hypothetical protein